MGTVRSPRSWLAVVLLAACGRDPSSADTDAGSSDETTSSTTASTSATTSSSEASSVADSSSESEGSSATTTDASSESSSTGAPPSGVPMFVTVGYGFRRAMSCDGGLTWVAEQVTDPAGGDDATLARGLGYGDGRFVASVGGGGNTGAIWTSDDGVEWIERVTAGTYNGFSQASYGDGYHVAGGGHVSIRSSDGSAWGDQGTMGEGGILRHIEFGDGWFVAVGGDRVQRSDDGMLWMAPDGDSCDGDYVDVVFGNGLFVAVSGSGHVCRSDDDGASWTQSEIGADVRGLGFNGEAFVATGTGDVLHSSDALQWNSAGQGGGPEIMALGDDGTMVGVAGDQFMQSTDGGASWTNTATSMNGGGFTRIEFGYGAPSAECPGQ